MRSTEPLSEQDIKVLKDLKVADKGLVILGLILGPVFAAIGMAMLLTSQGETDFVLTLIVLILLGIGCFAIAGSIWQYLRNRTYSRNPPHGNIKQVINDRLERVTLIKEKHLRYHFQGYTIDAYVPAGTGNPPKSFVHNRTIKQLEALSNTSLRLSFAEFKPGVNVVLDARYGNFQTTQSIQPQQEEDRLMVLSETRAAAGCFIVLCIIATIVLNVFLTFKLETALLSLGLPVLFIVLLSRYLYATKRRKVNPGENKIIIHTTLTEVITMLVKSGKSSFTYTYYRLADGLLVHIPQTGPRAGDNVRIQYMLKEDGSLGSLISMHTI